jgi:transcription antitermination factor NusG
MKNWFVLQTKPLKEAIVESLLREAGLRVYYPRVKEGDGRIHSLFPCYEFVHFDYPSQYRLVRFTRGVRRVVGNELGPIPIEAAVIQEIKAREVDGFIILEDDLGPPEPGDLIEVVKGPWRGLKGIFQRTLSSEQRVMILLNYVQYQGTLIVPRNQIRKARP